MVEAEGASACAKQVVIVGMPQLVLVGWYLALRRRSILRSRGLTLSSAVSWEVRAQAYSEDCQADQLRPISRYLGLG